MLRYTYQSTTVCLLHYLRQVLVVSGGRKYMHGYHLVVHIRHARGDINQYKCRLPIVWIVLFNKENIHKNCFINRVTNTKNILILHMFTSSLA